ncbi:PREDICTED: sorting nexin-20 isoform X2 [Bactrocera latifrons]|nr:PREDICTED: sorting nexin-20 isoform X2 [Bactrocera latifrons]XP_018794330.1 PREDICTED: sorting nexin-20 isoform X2 [Bactrocera latifrons]XP_018794331.1 PREDICTED: sorting nexin-20 isoform X2 [Bactrocera latifrons]
MARRTQVHSVDITDNTEELESSITIESGSLAINDDSIKPPQKDLWERPASLEAPILPDDGSTILRFEIQLARIMPPDGEDLKVKRYVIYELSVRQDSSIIDPQPATIQRRYTDFRNLYNILKKEFPNKMSTLYFPNKVLVGNFSADLIAERSAAFETFLTHVTSCSTLRDTPAFLHFLQDNELSKACQLLDERRNEMAIPLLENCFRLLNKIFMDRSRPVLLILCRLVAACTMSPVPHHSAERWATLALSRYDTLCDIDLLQLYIPLLHTCTHLWWQRGLDQKPITDRLEEMSKKGINTKSNVTLIQAIHNLDPRTETI